MAKIKKGAKITPAKGTASPILKGWAAFATFLGQTHQRWPNVGTDQGCRYSTMAGAFLL